jgi:hypothetical protein
MLTRTVPLLNACTTGTIGSSPFVSPQMPRSIYDALVIVTVENCSGAPSTATITPSFEVWHSVVGGNYFEVYETSGSGLSPASSWFAVSNANNPSMLPDGDWPATTDVHSATVSAPVSVFKSFVPRGAPWRLKVAWAFSGGTSPALTISAQAYLRETFGTPGEVLE